MVRKIRNTWWVDIGFKGERHRFRAPENSREGAFEYETLLRRRLAKGENLYAAESTKAKRAPLLSVWATEWEAKWIASDLKPSTVKGYRASVRRYVLPRLGRVRLDDITTSKIQDLKNDMLEKGQSAKTINNVLSVLRVMLDAAIDERYLEHVPRFKWMKKTPPNIDWLRPEESELLLRYVSLGHWHLLVLCALRTGMRFGELLGLRWDDIDFERNRIHVRHSVVDGIDGVPKNHLFREIPLALDLRAALLAAPRRAERVHVLPSAATPNRASAIEALERAYQAAGLRHVHWHMLRHTFATQLLDRGVDLLTVMHLLGHQSIEMTMRYVHINMRRMEDAIVKLASPRAARIGRSRQPDVNTPRLEASLES